MQKQSDLSKVGLMPSFKRTCFSFDNHCPPLHQPNTDQRSNLDGLSIKDTLQIAKSLSLETICCPILKTPSNLPPLSSDRKGFAVNMRCNSANNSECNEKNKTNEELNTKKSHYCRKKTVASAEAVARKEKSLGTLTDKFIELYAKKQSIPLDNTSNSSHMYKRIDIRLNEIAKEFNVEKRRIFDIVNVLESIEVVERKAMNFYQWIGFENLNSSLIKLRDSAFEDPQLYKSIHNLKVDSEESKRVYDCLTYFSQSAKQQKYDSKEDAESRKKREKSLSLLCQKFIQLFLISKMSVLSHGTAVDILIKNYNNISVETTLKTKTRRLHDIVNILSSLGLVKKVVSSECKKQICFKWIGQDLNCLLSQNEQESNRKEITNDPSQENKNFIACNSFISPSKNVPLKKRKRAIKALISPLRKKSQASNLTLNENNSSMQRNLVSMKVPDSNVTQLFTNSTTSSAEDRSQNNIIIRSENGIGKNKSSNCSQDRTGLHFQFYSPPMKKSRQSTDIYATTASNPILSNALGTLYFSTTLQSDSKDSQRILATAAICAIQCNIGVNELVQQLSSNSNQSFYPYTQGNSSLNFSDSSQNIISKTLSQGSADSTNDQLFSSRAKLSNELD
jgi:predicted DNA-binding protein YlxM (UPF0122 family)